jgi:hypothetical protein
MPPDPQKRGEKMGEMIKHPYRYIGFSTETKPLNPSLGSTLLEVDTGIVWVFAGNYWVPKNIPGDSNVSLATVSLNQVAGDYTVFTASGDLFIDAVLIRVPDDIHAVPTFTGISVQTDDTTPIVILSSTDGAKANLVGNFVKLYQGPALTANGKKIILTIGGGAAGAHNVLITAFWRPTAATGGYYK